MKEITYKNELNPLMCSEQYVLKLTSIANFNAIFLIRFIENDFTFLKKNPKGDE